MPIKRKLIKVDTPPGEQGFLGRGHIARRVIRVDFSQSDPFIILMDDMLDKQDGEPVGGPHPHAGFETVTLVLEGELGEDTHIMKAGDFEIMTAGGGVIHTETITKKTKVRILQLWLTLPKKDRWATPRMQRLSAEHVPSLSEDGVDTRLYSGSLAGLVSPVQNYTPLILAEVKMKRGAKTIQHIPANFNTVLYVINGSLSVGESKKRVDRDQAGWLDLFSDDVQSELKLKAEDEDARFVIYAAKPQRNDIVSHGPFVADTVEDIRRLYAEYRQNRMQHISAFPEVKIVTAKI